MTVAIVVLAAGFSRRLGIPKQGIEIDGETLLKRSVRTARAAGVGPVYVVVNSDCEAAKPLRPEDCMLILNREAEEGIASSIRAGVRGVLSREHIDGLLLMTCDQVAVRSSHLKMLCGRADQLCASGYTGRVGVPAYFPVRYAGELLKLKGDTGARELLARAQVVVAEDLAIDIDTQQDLAMFRQRQLNGK